MERQPESTVAPLYDEVVFECGLNLVSDRIEWRFRPFKARTNNANGYSEFTYLNKMVRISHEKKKSIFNQISYQVLFYENNLLMCVGFRVYRENTI